MPVESERKFLMRDQSWRSAVTHTTQLSQAYIAPSAETSVRVRVQGGKAFLTIKAGSDPLRRLEFEYEVPVADANLLLEVVCEEPIIHKARHHIPNSDGLIWEVDEFGGHLSGLVVAEVEFPPDHQEAHLPPWIGEEVTHDPRYLNSSLAKRDPRSEAH